jgi:hypothetical protein
MRRRKMRQPSRSTKRILLAWICLLLAFIACSPATPAPDTSAQQTQVALSIAETVAAGQGQPPATTEAPQVIESPTITPTPTPTESPWIEGSVERASYDPAAGLGAPDVHDDFSGTNPEFELDNSSGVAHGWYQNGRYNITFPTRGWWTWYKGSTSLTNFYVDIVVYNGDQCADRDASGLLFRYAQQWDSGSLFGVTCGGGYFIGVTGGAGPAGIVCSYEPNIFPYIDCSGMWDHPTSQYIDSGPGAANRIGVKALGQQISFYINGHQVDSKVYHSGWLFSGNFALYLGAGQRDNASVSFDDLSIWFNP